MLAPFMLGLSLMTPPADAAGTPKLIRYDSYADDGEIVVGAYFQEAPGFGKNSCMSQVYSFEEEDFPLVPTELRMFWAGEGAGETSELLLMVYFYWYEGKEADQYVMRAGQYRLLDQEEVLLTNIPNEGIWVDLDLDLNGFDFDGDPDTEGKQPIEYGSIIATVCYQNAQYSPALAMDTDGWKAEPIPEESDDFIEGHETSQFRSLIYWNGLWDDLHTYLLNTFGFPDGGDFIMRLVIGANWDDYGQEETGPDGGSGADGGGGNSDCKAGDWDLLSIEPDIVDPGTRTTVFIGSTYLVPDNSTATIGSWALLDAAATSTCGMTGDTDPDMEPGTYDVTIEAPDGTSRVLEDAFTIGEEPEGCGCSASTAGAAMWWAPLLGLGLLVRRRED